MVLARVFQSAIGYTIIAVICFHSVSSRAVDIHRSLLPLLFFVILDAARPIVELLEQSLIAISGAAIGCAFSLLFVAIGNRSMYLIGFIICNFIFAFFRNNKAVFIGYLCASIATEVILVAPISPTFYHASHFMAQLCTSCTLIILATLITLPSTSSWLFRDRLRQCLDRIVELIPLTEAMSAESNLSPHRQSDFLCRLQTLSSLSSSLPGLEHSSSKECYYGRIPLSTCQTFSRSIHEITSQLQGISFWRNNSGSYYTAPESWQFRASLNDPITAVFSALQMSISRVSSQMSSLEFTFEDDHVLQLRSSLSALYGAILSHNDLFRSNPKNALATLVLFFRLNAIANSVFEADFALRQLPRRSHFHFPALRFPFRRRSIDYERIGATRLGRTRDTAEILFAVKVALALGLLALPSFMADTRPFFVRWLSTWSMITASVVLTRTLGAVQTAITFRVVGTITGAACATILAALFRDNLLALSLVTFLLALGSYRVRYGSKRKLYRSLIVTWQLMFSNVMVTFISRYEDEPDLSIWTVPLEVSCQTGLALVLCWILMLFVVPTLARDLLRNRVANHLIWFGVLFDHLSRRVAIDSCRDEDDIASLERYLRWQLACEFEELLEQAEAEPNPFGTRFKGGEWSQLLAVMSDLLGRIELGHAALQHRPDIDEDLTGVLIPTPLINHFFVLAAALQSGTSLPPMPFVTTGRPENFVESDLVDEHGLKEQSDPVWKAAFDLAADDTNQLLAQVETILRSMLGEISFSLPRCHSIST